MAVLGRASGTGLPNQDLYLSQDVVVRRHAVTQCPNFLKASHPVFKCILVDMQIAVEYDKFLGIFNDVLTNIDYTTECPLTDGTQKDDGMSRSVFSRLQPPRKSLCLAPRQYSPIECHPLTKWSAHNASRRAGWA
ncbi:uncharacterized protein N7500_009351 [Penicillium coprophilum]|uniref:uncharacterized protein n=1 Tax=Penicillium coprophilum TaxID=36646 RepID=UPI00239219E3|nr:uncharacterized protein N7500_009351 [Penicillium coprophilum]KAJ5153912.1 hypothetical protein N7500_009351 [Penicillium coprophilum]